MTLDVHALAVKAKANQLRSIPHVNANEPFTFKFKPPRPNTFRIVGRIAASVRCEQNLGIVVPADTYTREYMMRWIKGGHSEDPVNYESDLVFHIYGTMRMHKAGQVTGGKMRNKKKRMYSAKGHTIIRTERVGACHSMEQEELNNGQ